MSRLDRRRWLRESGSTALASALGQGPGVLVGPAVAATLGATRDTDAAFYALAVATFVTATIAGAVQFAVVPFVVGAERDGLASVFLGEVRRLTIVASVLLAVAAAAIVTITLPRNAADGRIALAAVLVWLLSPYVIAATVAGLLVGALNARRDYWAAAISPAWRWGSVLAAVVLLGRWLGIWSLLVGYTVGEAIRVWLLSRRVTTFYGELPASRSWKMPGQSLLPFARNSAAQIVASGIIALLPVIDRRMAAALPAGSISTLEYADRLWQIPVGLAMSGLLVVALSEWSRDVQTPAGIREMVAKTRSAAWHVALAAVLPAAIVVWQRAAIAEALFGHGSFPPSFVPVLADVLGCYVAGIPVYLAGLTYTRAFLALQRSGWILVVAASETILKLLINRPLLDAMGLPGLAAATALMYVLGLVVLVSALEHLARKAEG